MIVAERLNYLKNLVSLIIPKSAEPRIFRMFARSGSVGRTNVMSLIEAVASQRTVFGQW